jgi:hypothetical protein
MIEAVEAGLGQELGFVPVAAHGDEETAHLGERCPPGPLDAPEGIAVLGQCIERRCLTAPTWSTITLTAWARMS